MIHWLEIHPFASLLAAFVVIAVYTIFFRKEEE